MICLVPGPAGTLLAGFSSENPPSFESFAAAAPVRVLALPFQ